MNSTEIIFAARGLNIRLSTTMDGQIRYPKDRTPEWLLESIKANKELLLRDLLLKEALDYLNERYVEGTDLSVLAAPEQRISEVYGSASLQEYRTAIREFVKVGLRAYAQTNKLDIEYAGTQR